MKFKIVLRGYDPKEVDKHLAETSAKEQEIRVAQKERIAELAEENRALKKLVKQYNADEQAISNAIIASHNLAQEVRNSADEYSEFVVRRAKIFCASWQAYSQTLVASLTDAEVKAFNAIQKNIERLIAEYEHGDEKEVAATEAKNDGNCVFSNPISRIEGASEHVIDLDELTTPTQSLEEICVELGLKKK